MSSSSGKPLFATTRWSVIASAGKHGSPLAEDALAAICEMYWYPLYAYIRRQGSGREEAEDVTQAFLADLLERKPWRQIDREKGKFRGFLLAALKHFLANARDHARRQKRGGRALHLSLDWQTADRQFCLADDSQCTPDQAYDREWGVRLLERVLARLGEEAAAEGGADRFVVLRDFLSGGGGSYESAAAALSMEAGAVRVAVHRLRKRYRALLREEISRTLADPAAVDDELGSLFAAFRS